MSCADIELLRYVMLIFTPAQWLEYRGDNSYNQTPVVFPHLGTERRRRLPTRWVSCVTQELLVRHLHMVRTKSGDTHTNESCLGRGTC